MLHLSLVHLDQFVGHLGVLSRCWIIQIEDTYFFICSVEYVKKEGGKKLVSNSFMSSFYIRSL